MEYRLDPERVLFVRDPMIYGQFLEHFHRQVYGGVFDPGSPFADEDGLRTDVIEALREISVPIVRWPGGCFVSSYDWKKGVGSDRRPVFDKAWRVEEPNTFGTDEFIRFCRKVGCEPYICTNAGTGTEQEMSDWVEYCNLDHEGEYARARIANGAREPYGVKYWSIGNENYGAWEIGAKDSASWSRLVEESAKMMKHVSPGIELSAAALDDPEWNLRLLTLAGKRLDWISIHGYWDGLWQVDDPAGYEACMAWTNDTDRSVRRIRGMLNALGLEKSVRIAFDEWNLRGWHHPNVHTQQQGIRPEEYLTPRDRNDINATYTMADAVFTACFLNMLLRNGDLVRMANFSPAVNTRGMIFTHREGIVRRSTWYVFRLFTAYLYDQVIDLFGRDPEIMTVKDKSGAPVGTQVLDAVATRDSASGRLALSLVNKHPSEKREVLVSVPGGCGTVRMHSVNGPAADSYNDVGSEPIRIRELTGAVRNEDGGIRITLAPHSVNVVSIG